MSEVLSGAGLGSVMPWSRIVELLEVSDGSMVVRQGRIVSVKNVDETNERGVVALRRGVEEVVA